jgi:prepilin-type N-terminal cleavage/methylation domain-containing protein
MEGAMKRRLGNRGVTLLELMVVIAIMGILATIAVPSYLTWLPKLRVDGATGEVSSDLQTARMRAVSENTPYAVLFDLAGNSYSVYKDSNWNGALESSELISFVHIQDEYPGVKLGYNVSKGPYGDAITANAEFKDQNGSTVSYEKFMPNGTAVYTGAVYLAVADDLVKARYNRSRAITVESTGFVKTWRYNSNVQDNPGSWQ